MSGIGIGISPAFVPGSASGGGVDVLSLTLPQVQIEYAFSISAITTPDVIFGANLKQWCRADSGDITIATGVSQWNDKTANAHNYAQATGANQPAFTASDATIGNKGSILFDGSNDTLINTTLDLGTPGASGGIYIFLILKQIGWTAGRIILGSGAAVQCQLTQNTGTPEIRMNDGGGTSLADATHAPTGTWVLVELLFSNSTSDFLRVGNAGSDVTGVNVGNTDPAASRSIASRNGGASTHTNIAVAEIGYVTGITSFGTKRAELRSYIATYYGGAVTTP